MFLIYYTAKLEWQALRNNFYYSLLTMKKIILYSNTGWYLFNFRLALLLALKKQGYEVVLVAPRDKYTSELEARGLRVIAVKMNRRNLNPFSELLLLFSLFTIFKKESPDIVFNFTVKCAVYGSLVAMLLGIRRRVNAVAGLGIVFSSQKRSMLLLRYLVIRLLRISLSGKKSRVILQNPDDVTFFIDRLGITKDRIVLIKGSGVNSVTFSNTVELASWPLKPAKVLFASRLLWDKGIGDFVNAAKELKNSEKYQFLIAGESDTGNPNAVSQHQLDEWASTGVVSLLGHIYDMPKLLKEVDLVVLPSVYGEGVPRILIESAASSLPLIAFDVPGSREIVVNHVNGFLVDRHASATLARKIELIFSDNDAYLSMCNASRNHFLKEFEETSVINRTIAVVKSTKNASSCSNIPATE